MDRFPSIGRVTRYRKASGRGSVRSVGRCADTAPMGSGTARASRAERRQIDTLSRNRQKYGRGVVTNHVRSRFRSSHGCISIFEAISRRPWAFENVTALYVGHRGSALGGLQTRDSPPPEVSRTRGFLLETDDPSPTRIFDAAAMVLIELLFIMLWSGVVMGAIWPDHSWGRPWGWDPKEVFAIN